MSNDFDYFKLFLSALTGGFTSFLAFLARDWNRDKKFQNIREEQKEDFTCKLREFDTIWLDKYICKFDAEKRHQFTQMRDAIRDLKKKEK